MRFVIPSTARSWVPKSHGSEFPIQNLPFGLAQPKGRNESIVVAIGEFALDLSLLGVAGLLDDEQYPILDSFIELNQESLSSLRQRIFELLEESNAELRDKKKLREDALIPLAKANLQVPIPPTAFVDFYSGIHHATNVGKMFRPDGDPLLPNYRHIPIGYNGRASSVVASGTPIIRPKGQIKVGDDVLFEPTREMDFELELGFYISEGNAHGKRITCTSAEEHILGFVLVNDWSARDIQRWEYQPLGPFLAKSFATTVSPWIVTLDALEPFRIEAMAQDPPVLPYLRTHGPSQFEIQLEVHLKTPKMKVAQKVSTSNSKYLYWSPSQQIAHQTSNGTPIEFGDLYASGTISGPAKGEEGSMLELSWKGQHPVTLDSTGETRSFLLDGDSITLTGFCQGDGYRISFGECTGEIRAPKE